MPRLVLAHWYPTIQQKVRNKMRSVSERMITIFVKLHTDEAEDATKWFCESKVRKTCGPTNADVPRAKLCPVTALLAINP